MEAYSGGGVECYDASQNAPYWNAGSCNCRRFGTGDLGSRPSGWKNPTSGVVRAASAELASTQSSPRQLLHRHILYVCVSCAPPARRLGVGPPTTAVTL